MRGGRGRVRGLRRRLVLGARLRWPVLRHSLPLRGRARWRLVAGAAGTNEGLERQSKRPSHLGKKGTLTPNATAPWAGVQEGRLPTAPRSRSHSASPRLHLQATAWATQ